MTIKERALQWIKLELAFQVYGEISYDDFGEKVIKLGKNELIFNGNELRILYDEGGISYVIKKGYIAGDNDKEIDDKIEEIINDYELPESITDILIIRVLQY